MKKFVLAAMAVLLLNVNAFAYTESHITKDVSVKVDDELTGSRAPKLVIDECGDFEGLTGTTDFSLMLENAEWLYDGSGTIENGIGYMVISSNEMIITVDTDIYDAASRGIEIPVYAKITDGGTASLTIDGKNSPVSSETLTFAHSGYPNMEITIKGPDDGSSVFSLSFKDNYPYQLVNGRIYELKLTNGFNFTGKANVSDSGKFAGRAEFAVDKNKSTAYVKLETQSGTGSGTIDITGIGIEPTAKSQSGDIELSTMEICQRPFIWANMRRKMTALIKLTHLLQIRVQMTKQMKIPREIQQNRQ